MDAFFKSTSNFASLSIKDLLEGRELFHYHLMNKKNVVSTAIGLYRIRKDDPWPSKANPKSRTTTDAKKSRRTLFNSEVRPYSWPCVYVFVSHWDDEMRLARANPSDVVPKSLYLPDGRVIPVCVIEARKQGADDLHVNGARRPRNLLGPGVTLVNEQGQGMTRGATVGCIVRDGDYYYALTNRHAVGAPGNRIKAMLGTRTVDIGTTAEKALDREDFRTVYPHYTSNNQRLLLDVGLVTLDDVTRWKTTFPSLPQVEPVLDVYDNNLNLHLIGMKVVGESSISGVIRGEIHALFYRFKAQGGSEYIGDFLIGPETRGPGARHADEDAMKDVSFVVQHGDSGTVLHIEHEEDDPSDDSDKKTKRYYPFALLWGKEQYVENGERKVHPFALATSLSTSLDLLDLDLVRDINLDQQYIWGWLGHYAIGGLLPVALETIGTGMLKSLITKNLSLLTIVPEIQNAKTNNDPRVLDAGASSADNPQFVPLADVPDNVWKANVNFFQVEGDDGKKHRHPGPGARGQVEHPNHFADMDLPYKEYKTFLDYNMQNRETNPNPADWLEYYKSVAPKYQKWAEALGKASHPQDHWGALPFRVWQLFDAMVAAARAGDQDKFLCAGGVLIHYVGDACQPLHTSYLSQGDPDRVQADGKKLEADGVHSGYEDDMINLMWQKHSLADELTREVKRQEDAPDERIGEFSDGSGAAKALIKLIAATHGTIAPRDIVDNWTASVGSHKSDRVASLYDAFGDGTVVCMARGARYLGRIWMAAWQAGDGDEKIGEGKRSEESALMKLYAGDAAQNGNGKVFVPSLRLDQYDAILKVPAHA